MKRKKKTKRRRCRRLSHGYCCRSLLCSSVERRRRVVLSAERGLSWPKMPAEAVDRGLGMHIEPSKLIKSGNFELPFLPKPKLLCFTRFGESEKHERSLLFTRFNQTRTAAGGTGMLSPGCRTVLMIPGQQREDHGGRPAGTVGLRKRDEEVLLVGKQRKTARTRCQRADRTPTLHTFSNVCVPA